MATDIKLNDGENEDWVTVEGSVLNAQVSDLILESKARRKGGERPRRALVHNAEDGLTVNFNGDYPGGVTVLGARLLGARLQLRVEAQDDLPKDGQIGDLLLTHTVVKKDFDVREKTTLWLCTGHKTRVGADAKPRSVALWQPVTLGDPVDGIT